LILTTTIETELGTMIAGAVEEGICLLEFSDRKILNSEYRDLKKYLAAEIEEGENSHTLNLKKQLAEYFKGTRKVFDVQLIIPGTIFQQMVWNELLSIPYGTTRTYLEQAEALRKPESIRAVANANGMNRIAIIIPCHRVIGSNGSLTGYGGGLKRKKWLLDHEKRNSGQAFDQLLF
jgi:AraC family transcriptional regulator, regulatory protein of adaptative response / methylated-DNA-[protein]-cysteine methyltransferase